MVSRKSACDLSFKKNYPQDFPGGAVDKNLPANARDTGLIPGLEDSICHGTTKPMCHNF